MTREELPDAAPNPPDLGKAEQITTTVKNVPAVSAWFWVVLASYIVFYPLFAFIASFHEPYQVNGTLQTRVLQIRFMYIGIEHH